MRNATITRSTWWARTSWGTSPTLPRTGRFDLGTQPWAVVDEADDSNPILGVLGQFSRDQLSNVPGANDECALFVRGRRRDRARQGSSGRHQEDREGPEGGDLGQIGVSETGEPGARKEKPGTDRDEVEDANDFIDGRVIRPRLIMVVQPVEVRHEDPHGQRGKEEVELGLEADTVLEVAARRDHELRGDERDREANEVGGDERPPDERRARMGRPAGTARLERIARRVVRPIIADPALGQELRRATTRAPGTRTGSM